MPALFKRYVGDRGRGQQYLGQARVLLSRMVAFLGGQDGAKTWQLADGTKIRTVAAGGVGIVTIDVTETKVEAECTPLQKKALTGFAFRPATDDLPLGIGDDVPVSQRSRIAVLSRKPVTGDLTGYRLWLKNKAHHPSEDTHATDYDTREIDTCGTREPWLSSIEYGNIDWRGPDKLVLSWHGVPTRYLDGQYAAPIADVTGVGDVIAAHQIPGFIYSQVEPTFSGTSAFVYTDDGWTEFRTDKRVFFQGGAIYSSVDADDLLVPGTVVAGAALTLSPTGAWWLIVIDGTGSDKDRITTERVYAYPVEKLAANELIVGARQTLLTQAWPAMSNRSDGLPRYGFNVSPWLFNESGTQAVANRTVATDALHRHFLNLTWVDEAPAVAIVQSDQTYSMAEASSVSTTDYPDKVGTFTATDTDWTVSTTWGIADYVGDTLVTAVAEFYGHRHRHGFGDYHEGYVDYATADPEVDSARLAATKADLLACDAYAYAEIPPTADYYVIFRKDSGDGYFTLSINGTAVISKSWTDATVELYAVFEDYYDVIQFDNQYRTVGESFGLIGYGPLDLRSSMAGVNLYAASNSVGQSQTQLVPVDGSFDNGYEFGSTHTGTYDVEDQFIIVRGEDADLESAVSALSEVATGNSASTSVARETAHRSASSPLFCDNHRHYSYEVPFLYGTYSASLMEPVESHIGASLFTIAPMAAAPGICANYASLGTGEAFMWVPLRAVSVKWTDLGRPTFINLDGDADPFADLAIPGANIRIHPLGVI
jgi:hypothetical protein